MKKHIELLGILHIIYHSLGLIIAVIVVLLLGRGIILSCEEVSIRQTAAFLSIYRLFAIAILSIVLLFSVSGIIGGIGLLLTRPWGRILALIMGFVSLIKIPFGTALGIYTIWALMNDRTIEMFEAAGRGSSGGASI